VSRVREEARTPATTTRPTTTTTTSSSSSTELVSPQGERGFTPRPPRPGAERHHLEQLRLEMELVREAARGDDAERQVAALHKLLAAGAGSGTPRERALAEGLSQGSARLEAAEERARTAEAQVNLAAVKRFGRTALSPRSSVTATRRSRRRHHTAMPRTSCRMQHAHPTKHSGGATASH
jgi:hypothetical protein